MNKYENNVAMREALVRLREIANTAFERMREGVEIVNLPQAIWYWCEKAMLAPPRNCDVGTAEEQAARFAEFCTCHSKNGARGICDGKCPFHGKEYGSDCAMEWGQMPYEENA